MVEGTDTEPVAYTVEVGGVWNEALSLIAEAISAETHLRVSRKGLSESLLKREITRELDARGMKVEGINA